MLTHGPIKRYLICRRLHRLRSGRYFVKKKNVYHVIAFVHSENLRFQPYRKSFVLVCGRNTSQVNRIEQQQSYIGDVNLFSRTVLYFLCYLPYRLRFTHTGCSPKHDRRHSPYRQTVVYYRYICVRELFRHTVYIHQRNIGKSYFFIVIHFLSTPNFSSSILTSSLYSSIISV